MVETKSYRLRYVGPRYDGARLPLDVLSDLPAFRDLLVSYAKDEWRSAHIQRKRLPRGFDKSIAFDLVAIEEGSAVPKLNWNRETAQDVLPGLADELSFLVDHSYERSMALIDGAGNRKFPLSLSSEHIGALNKLGAGLREGERIEFLGSQGADGNVVYLDTFRRKSLITHVRDTYQTRYEGLGKLLGSHIDAEGVSGFITVRTDKYGDIRISLEPDRIAKDFDGYIHSVVQFALQIELDHSDAFRSVVDVFEVEVIDEQDGLDPIRARLAELRTLQPGWHDGGGEAIDSAAAESAERFIEGRPLLAKTYRVYPTYAGGVLFEFERNGWDFSVEFGPGGSIEMYGVKIEGPEELCPQAFSSLDDEFMRVFDQHPREPE